MPWLVELLQATEADPSYFTEFAAAIDPDVARGGVEPPTVRFGIGSTLPGLR